MTIHAQKARQRLHLLPQPQTSGSASSELSNPVSESVQRIRKNVTLACEECKVKKRRCNGKYPCRICLDQALCCQFRPESDRRRVRATFSILSEKVSKYERLFDVLRGGSSGEAIQALYCLRSSHIENQQEPDCSSDMVLDKVLRLVDAGLSNSALTSHDSAEDRNSTSTSWSNRQPLSDNTACLIDISMTSTYMEEPRDVATVPVWRPHVRTDWSLAMEWLNQDMDELERLVPSLQSR